MEWVGLMIWLVAAGIGLGVAGLGGLTSPSLGIAGLLAGAGLVLCVVYLALDGPRWPAWASAGVAVAAFLLTALGSVRLLSDEPRSASAGQDAEELAAGLVGAELPLLVVTAFAMFLAAAGITAIG
jgi:hypothetical protein